MGWSGCGLWVEWLTCGDHTGRRVLRCLEEVAGPGRPALWSQQGLGVSKHQKHMVNTMECGGAQLFSQGQMRGQKQRQEKS